MAMLTAAVRVLAAIMEAVIISETAIVTASNRNGNGISNGTAKGIPSPFYNASGIAIDGTVDALKLARPLDFHNTCAWERV